MAVRNVEVTNKTFGPCLQVARGWFFQWFDSAEQKNQMYEAGLNWAGATSGGAITLNRLWGKQIWMAAQPDFVFEARIVPSSCEKVPSPPRKPEEMKNSSQSADSGDKKRAPSPAKSFDKKVVSSSGDTSGKKDGSSSDDSSENQESCANEQALAMVPTYARLNAPISQAVLRPSKAREVAVFFAFADAGGNLSPVSEAPARASCSAALNRARN